MHQLLDDDLRKDTLILAVSPDTVEQMRQAVARVTAKTGKPFAITLLSDPDHAVIDRYGLLNEDAAARARFLPHPTTYVIDREGIVRWKYTEKNYRVRPANQMVLRELRKLR